jgi:hypothetical protein
MEALFDMHSYCRQWQEDFEESATRELDANQRERERERERERNERSIWILYGLATKKQQMKFKRSQLLARLLSPTPLLMILCNSRRRGRKRCKSSTVMNTVTRTKLLKRKSKQLKTAYLGFVSTPKKIWASLESCCRVWLHGQQSFSTVTVRLTNLLNRLRLTPPHPHHHQRDETERCSPLASRC